MLPLNFIFPLFLNIVDMGDEFSNRFFLEATNFITATFPCSPRLPLPLGAIPPISISGHFLEAFLIARNSQ